MAKSNKIRFSDKYLLIDKANTLILVAVSVTVAVVCFSLVVSLSLAKQIGYQNKVINLRREANKELEKKR